MRKVLSLVLAAVTFVSGMVIAPSVASAATLDKQNVAAEAYYYGGQVSFVDITGNAVEPDGSNPIVKDDYGVIKEGDASRGQLVLDGTIKKGEWGDPVVVVDSNYAANNGGVRWATNMDFETASAENTFYYYLDKAPKKGLKYELYMMWDEDYMYVAAKTSDPDGHHSGNSGTEAWNGDSFQFRVDTKGPNSSVGGKGYDSRGESKKAPYDLFLEPWEGAIYNDRHWNIGERVCNFVFTYTTNGGGMTELWDGARRYTPIINENYTDLNGNNVPTLEYQQHDVSWFYYDDGNEDNLPGDEGIWGVAYPKMSGIPSNPKFTTTYEFAIPWDIIEEGYTPSAGAELGVAAALFNAATGGSYNSWLSWGSGVSMDQLRWNPQTVGGSNSLTLSDKPYTTSRCSHATFKPADCQNPETCANCGYQRGMKANHDYKFSDTVIPTTKTAGSITATCSVCGDTQVRTINPGADNVTFSFKTSDDSIINKGFNDGYTTEWKDGPNDPTTNGRTGNTIFVDGKIKNSFDNKLFPGEAIMDLATNGSHVATVDSSVTNADHTGTYFEADSIAPSYTQTMEVYFPKSLDAANDLTNNGYNAGIRNSFGDNTTYDFYGAGLYRIEGKYFFGICDVKRGDGIGYTAEEFKANALSWSEATEEDVATDKWHQYAFMYDEESGTVMFAWDGELKAAATDDRMKYNDDDNSITPFWRRYNIGLYVKNVQIGGLGLFSQYAGGEAPEPAVKYTATIDGVAAEYEAGETVKISAPVTKTAEDGTALNFVKWTGDIEVLADATVAEAEFVMPEKDVTLNSEYEPAAPVVEGDLNDDGIVTAEDSNMLKQMLIGKIEKNLKADLDGDGKVSTKDSFKMRKLIVQ